MARFLYLGMGIRLIFCVFFTSQTVVSPRMFEQNLADLFGVSMYVLLLNITEKFHYLGAKHVNVMSSSLAPTFCNFSENS